jgi:SAM-dependent methyltransferase
MSPSDHDAAVRRSFEHQVGLFAGEDSPFARRPASQLAWVEPLDTDMMVLDVACGAAHVAEQLAPHVRQVVGVDLTGSLLELGAERLRRTSSSNVLLQEGNANTLPFVDASFDLVVCRGSLHHFPHPERPVEEMARVCRPGGRVVVSDMVPPSAQVRERFDEVHRDLDPSHAGVLLEDELADLVRVTVGSLTYGETTDPIRLPIDDIFTEVSDREAVLAALQAELDGGRATGFEPADDGGHIVVSFTSTVVHATRNPDR